MRIFNFNAEVQRRRGFAGYFKALALSVFCLAAVLNASAEYAVANGVATIIVPKPASESNNNRALQDLQNALNDSRVSKVIITGTISLTNGTYLSADTLVGVQNQNRKIVQVEEPFIPEDGKITLTKTAGSAQANTIDFPVDGSYSTYKLFDIPAGSSVVISNITLMGGFEGKRTVSGDDATTGGIDNYGHLTMYDVDITRTGTALLNRPSATAVLVDCNIVRNANWYGGGILNFAKSYKDSSGDTAYKDGGTLIMDRCSLTENQSLGPSHGGGAAENQGLMCLNNCIVANNASTEIGGGINNCKGGDLYVMNSTFTGNITTADEYGITAGGAIGNAGGAGNVYIVNSILAHNGYDTGEFVNSGSLGRYDGSTTEHYCHVANTAIDAYAGMDRLNATNFTVHVDGLFAGDYRQDGIIAAGGQSDTDGINKSSDFPHPHIVRTPQSEIYGFAPEMVSVETNHYLFGLAVDTYFNYTEILEGKSDAELYMGYKEGNNIVLLGNAEDVSLPSAEMLVTVTFDGETRLPEDGYQHNALGAATVKPLKTAEKPDDPNVFLVTLGSFTGGMVSGVTKYGDSYLSNSVVTVHAFPESAYYLNGWKINGEVVTNTAQKLIYSFQVLSDIEITPVFQPVVTQIYKAVQRYPWNNLVDIDYSVAETNAVKYRLVFFASYEENGITNTIQLKTFRRNDNINETQRLGERWDLHRDGDHRVTWDSAADGVQLKGKEMHYRAVACEGEER